MSSGRTPGIDGIPPELLKNGGSCMLECLTELFSTIWKEEAVPRTSKML